MRYLERYSEKIVLGLLGSAAIVAIASSKDVPQPRAEVVVHVEGADGEYASFATMGEPLEFPLLGVTVTVLDEEAAEAMAPSYTDSLLAAVSCLEQNGIWGCDDPACPMYRERRGCAAAEAMGER